MKASGSSPSSRKFVIELDVLRGIAAVLMIVNHAGYRLLSADDAVHSGIAPAVFLGSIAPAVFFSATGFGIGLSRSSTPLAFDWFGVLWKAALLVVADQFFFWSRGASWGLDFFSFIAIATVTVSLISQLRQAIGICISLSIFLLILRYGIAPILGGAEHPMALAEWFLGVRTVSDVSYPLSPWMVFPLMGFVCGTLYKRVSLTSPEPRNDWFKRGGAIAVVCFALALGMSLLNRGFFRWGTVSVAYFVLAVGVVAVAGLFSMALVICGGSASRALSLRGVASFAVIPLHYAMLELITRLLPQPVSTVAFAAITTCVIAAAFYLSSRFVSAVSRLTTASHQHLLFSLLVGLVFALCSAVIFDPMRDWMPSALVTMLAQLAIAALLAMKPPLIRSQVPVSAT
jgi:uncharacterized membrane protein